MPSLLRQCWFFLSFGSESQPHWCLWALTMVTNKTLLSILSRPQISHVKFPINLGL